MHQLPNRLLLCHRSSGADNLLSWQILRLVNKHGWGKLMPLRLLLTRHWKTVLFEVSFWILLLNDWTLCSNWSVQCGLLLQSILYECLSFNHCLGRCLSCRLLLPNWIWIPYSLPSRKRMPKCYNERWNSLYCWLLLHCWCDNDNADPFTTRRCKVSYWLLLPNRY